MNETLKEKFRARVWTEKQYKIVLFVSAVVKAVFIVLPMTEVIPFEWMWIVAGTFFVMFINMLLAMNVDYFVKYLNYYEDDIDIQYYFDQVVKQNG